MLNRCYGVPRSYRSGFLGIWQGMTIFHVPHIFWAYPKWLQTVISIGGRKKKKECFQTSPIRSEDFFLDVPFWHHQILDPRPSDFLDSLVPREFTFQTPMERTVDAWMMPSWGCSSTRGHVADSESTPRGSLWKQGPRRPAILVSASYHSLPSIQEGGGDISRDSSRETTKAHGHALQYWNIWKMRKGRLQKINH